MLRLIIYLFLLSTPVVALADSSQAIGEIAGNLMEPVNILSDFIANAAIIIGAMFIFASGVKYMRHRENPQAVPISDVVFLLIFGIVLICLPISYKLAYNQAPSSVATDQKTS